MNATRFQNSLLQRLFDPNGVVFPANLVAEATASAVREYSSKKEGVMRLFGQGNLTQLNLVVGATTMQYVGGPFANGQQVILDQNTPIQETVTIGTISTPTETGVGQIGYILQATISPTIFAHDAGGFVELPPSQIGFNLVAGQAIYPLPRDFISPDTDSLDVSMGVKAQVRRTDSYYGYVYDWSQAFVGSVWGLSQQTQIGPNLGYPYWYPVQAPPTTLAGVTPVNLMFTMTDNPRLTVSPPPPVTKTVQWSYQGSHTIETVPDSDFELVLRRARAACIDAKEVDMARRQPGESVQIQWHPEKSAAELRLMAKEDMEFFYRYTDQRPYMTSG